MRGRPLRFLGFVSRVAMLLRLSPVVLVVTGVGCEARSSVEAAQTAVVAVQTAMPTGQVMVPQLETLLAGVSLDIRIQPDGAANDAVTSVSISGKDGQDRLSQVDARGRQAAAGGALVLAAQYYPNATISISVVDASGSPLVIGTKAPGQAPSIQ